MDTPQETRAMERHAYFLMLAARSRERAERTSNATLADSHIRLAEGYEALARSVLKLERQPITLRRTG